MSDRVRFAVLGAGMFTLYAALSCRTLYWHDSGEFVYVAETGGIPHPTGYPLYTMIATLVARLPGSTAFALSLLSAAAGALAVAWLYSGLRRLEVGGPLAAAAAFTGLGASIVDQSTIPEVYTLHLLLNVVVVERVLAWRTSGHVRDLALGAFALGLAFCNHLTTVWLVPPLGVVLWRDRALLRRGWLTAAGCFGLGLLPWLYLPILAATEPLYNQGDPTTPERFLALVTGAHYQHKFLSLSPAEVLEQARLYARSLLSQWSPGALVFLPVGVVAISRTLPATVTVAGLLWWLGAVAFIVNYSIPDKDGYYLVPHMLAGLAVAAGASRALSWIRSRLGPRAAGLRPAALAWCLALLPLLWTFRASRADNTSFVDYTLDVWRNLPPGTLLLTEDLNLHYGTLLLQREGALPPDVTVVSRYLIGFTWYQRFLRRRYPDLHLPSLERRTTRFERVEDRVRGPELAARRGRIVEQMALDIVAANLGRRPVALLPIERGTEPTTYGPFHLRGSGIAFTVHEERPGRASDSVELREKYLAGRRSFRDEGERMVAARYSLAMFRFGVSLMERREYEAAADAFRRAARYDRTRYGALKNLGAVLIHHLGRVDEGRETWREYAEIAGDDADPQILRYLRP